MVNRLIAIQFMLSKKFVQANPDVLSGVRVAEPEPQEDRTVRKLRNKYNSDGICLIQPTKRVDISDLFHDITAGYELADAKQQLRRNDRGDYDHVVRYLFVKREFLVESPELIEFATKRDNILAGLWVLCGCMWRTQVYQNPFYKEDGEVADDCVALSVNLKEREELFRPDGQPVTVWQKDEKGNRVGDAPLPLKANYRLRIAEDTVSLLAV